MKKVIFLCGSPKAKESSSYSAATYLSKFLECPFEFIDVAAARLSYDAEEAETSFIQIVDKIKEANVVVWTFGAICWHAPPYLMLLFDKLFAQKYKFEGKIAAAVMSGAHLLDDYILEKLEFISEQLGFGYLNDVSVEGVPGGYLDYEEGENSCRVLANQINQALTLGFVPCRKSAYIEPRWLSPMTSAPSFTVKSENIVKDQEKTILVISGRAIKADSAADSIYKSIKTYTKNNVDLIEIEKEHLNPCRLNYHCLLKVGVHCAQNDALENLKMKMMKADGIVYIGHCQSAFVDAYLQSFLGRAGSLLVMPQLKGKYGFSVTVGGGDLGKDTAAYLDKILRRYGVYVVAKLVYLESNNQTFAKNMKWAVQNLDQALDEKWITADRFTSRAEHYYMREGAAQSGMIARNVYNHFFRNKLFDFPFFAFLLSSILYPIFKSKTISDFVWSQSAKKTKKEQAKRLEKHLRLYKKD